MVKIPPGHLVAFVPSGWGTSIDLPGVDALQVTPAGTYVEGPKHSIETLAAHGHGVRILEDATQVGRGALFRDYRQKEQAVPSPERLEWQGAHATYPFLIKTLGDVPAGAMEHFSSGGRVLKVDDSSYLAEFSVSRLPEIESLPFVAWVEPYHYAYRIDPWLAAVLAGDEVPVSQPLSVRVVGLPSIIVERLRADVAGTGGVVLADFTTVEGASLIVQGTVEDIRLLHRLEIVAWIEPGSIQPCAC